MATVIENGISRKVAAGSQARIMRTTKWMGKAVGDMYAPSLTYPSEVRYPNSIRVD